MSAHQFHRIPTRMTLFQQFVVWKFEYRDGKPKPTKVPYSPKNAGHADVNNAHTWGSFDDAVGAYEVGGWDGIGFVLTKNDPFCFIDIDDPEGNDSVLAHQREIIEACQSYSEYSPSGSGLHIITEANVDAGRRRDKIEVYSDQRYMTMTGNVFRDGPITDQQTFVSMLWHSMAGASSSANASEHFVDATESDEAIFNKASSANNGEKFGRLWSGDATAVEGNDKSGSSIDQALVNILAFYSKDPRQVERLWLMSPQGQREKTQSRTKYRHDTITRAFDREAPKGNFEAITSQLSSIVQKEARASWPQVGTIGETEWSFAQPSPRAIVENLFFEDVGVFIAAGGTGKTTFALWAAIHIVLGIELCGHAVTSPGPVVIVTAEDSREMLVARLRQIATELFPHGTLSDDERAARIAAIRNGIVIVDVSARVQRLTMVDRDVVRVDDAAVDGLASFLAPLKPSLLLIDPAVSFGVGEGRVNDAEQGLIEAGRRLRRTLACAVIYVHHTGKANAREKTEDQYSGRGGSAFADGSRMVFVMNRLTPKDWHAETGTILEPGETGLKINVAKLSYSAPQRPIFLTRNGFKFSHVEVAARSDGDRDAQDDEQVLSFISDEAAKGIPHSRKTIESANIGLSRARIRGAITRLLIEHVVERVDPGKATTLIPTPIAALPGEGV